MQYSTQRWVSKICCLPFNAHALQITLDRYSRYSPLQIFAALFICSICSIFILLYLFDFQQEQISSDLGTTKDGEVQSSLCVRAYR